MPRDFQRPFVLPEGATEVLLVRHGSSGRQPHVDGLDLVDGQNDPPLDEAGLRQAEAVSMRLAQWRADQLFVTPLRRTRQTAAPLAERLRGGALRLAGAGRGPPRR